MHVICFTAFQTYNKHLAQWHYGGIFTTGSQGLSSYQMRDPGNKVGVFNIPVFTNKKVFLSHRAKCSCSYQTYMYSAITDVVGFIPYCQP